MENINISKAVDIYVKNLDEEDVSHFKQVVGVDLKEMILELIQEISNEYQSLGKISINADDYGFYIFKPDNGKYDIETFLLNRLFRNVSEIHVKKHNFFASSEFEPDERIVEYDEERIIRLKESGAADQVKKLIFHELLHAFKSVPYEIDFFDSKKYCELKRLLYNSEFENINDFDEKMFKGDSILRNHISTGIEYQFIGRKLYPQYEKYDQRLENADEIFNEIDSIDYSKLKTGAGYLLDDKNFILVRNVDSSNAYITNYANIFKRMFTKEVWFYGQYCKPEVLIEIFNRVYGSVFQNYNNSSNDGFSIFVQMLDAIKEDPKNVGLHAKLLDCLYECAGIRNLLLTDQVMTPNFFRANGLLCQTESAIVTSPVLSYANDLENNIDHIEEGKSSKKN